MQKEIMLGFMLVTLMSGSAGAVTVVLNDNPGAAFEATPMGVNPSTGQETSSFNWQAQFTSLLGPSPNALPTQNFWGETPTAMSFGFSAMGDHVKVETFQELGLDIFGDYWTLDSKLTFNPSSAIIVDPNDHIIWEGTLQHTGKLSTSDFPHEGDTQAGPVLPFSIDLSAGNKEDALFGQLTHALTVSAGDHDFVGHADVLFGIMQARVVSPSPFFDEIQGSYTGILGAFHLDGQNPVVPEPATVVLLGAGLAAALMRRQLLKGSRL